MSSVRRLLILLSLFSFLLLAVLVSVPYWLNAGVYKDLVIDMVKDKSGRDIEIAGDITLKIVPDIALVLNDVSVSSEIGDKKLLKLSQLVLNVRVLPLLQKKVEVISFRLVDPSVYMHILPDGTKNWELSQSVGDDSVTTVEADDNTLHSKRDVGSSVSVQEFLQLDELSISNGSFYFVDEQNNQLVDVSDIFLDTALNKSANPFTLSGKLNVFDNKSKGEFAINGTHFVQNNIYGIQDASLKLDNIEGMSNVVLDLSSDKLKSKVSLYLDNIDLNNYEVDIDHSSDKQNDVAVKTNKTPAYEHKDFAWDIQNIDFDFVDLIELNFSLKSNSVTYGDISAEDVLLNVYMRNNNLTVSLKNAAVFDGSVDGKVIIDNNNEQPVFKSSGHFHDIHLSKLPKLLKDSVVFEGVVNGKLNVKSKGSTQKQIVKNLGGTSSIRFVDGKIKSLDLLKMVKNINSAFNKKRVSDGTRFDEITGSFYINSGVVMNNDLVIKSDLLNLVGTGELNLNNMLVNYKVTPKYSQDIEKSNDGPRIPILVSGNIFRPVFRLEVKTIVEDLIQNPKATENLVKQLKRDFKQIKHGLKDDVGGSSLKNIKDLFK